MELFNGDFCISTNRDKLDLGMIHQFLSTEAYWSKNIPFATVERAAASSLCFGVYEGTQQIGYARIISDYASFAYLCDVFIVPAYRGKGLSKWLLQAIMEHPQLQGLRRWMLATADAHGLYTQFGWQPVAAPERWMEIHHAGVYQLPEQ